MLLLPFNIALAVVASLLGVLVASQQQDMPPIRAGVEHAAFSTNFGRIASNNFAVAGQMLLGTFTLGVYSLCLLLWNAFRIGFDLAYVARSAPNAMVGLNSFLFIEYGYVCTLASVAESGALNLLWYLLRARHPAFLRRCVALGFVSFALIVVAAGIEAFLLARGTR